jgi:serine/threonine protein kinase
LDQIFPWPNRPKKKYNGPKLPYDFEIFSQLASGLEYIHSKNIIHQDIKPANVLISVDSGTAAGQQQEKVTMKWADFGVSTSVDGRGTCSMKSSLTGTIFWCAPEVLGLIFKLPNAIGKTRGTVKSDVFAMGLVLALILLGGRHLYGPGKINNNIVKGKMKLIDGKYYTILQRSNNISNEFKNLI